MALEAVQYDLASVQAAVRVLPTKYSITAIGRSVGALTQSLELLCRNISVAE